MHHQSIRMLFELDDGSILLASSLYNHHMGACHRSRKWHVPECLSEHSKQHQASNPVEDGPLTTVEC
jgi:hypothetical protein